MNAFALILIGAFVLAMLWLTVADKGAKPTLAAPIVPPVAPPSVPEPRISCFIKGLCVDMIDNPLTWEPVCHVLVVYNTGYAYTNHGVTVAFRLYSYISGVEGSAEAWVDTPYTGINSDEETALRDAIKVVHEAHLKAANQVAEQKAAKLRAPFEALGCAKP